MIKETDFDKQYFEDGIATGKSGYVNYTWSPEISFPLAHNIIHHLGLQPNMKILDFGCAKGYLVKAFQAFGYDAYGVDISNYAISSAPKEVRTRVRLVSEHAPVSKMFRENEFDICIAKDVLEHIEYKTLSNVLQDISKVARSIFVAVPLGDGSYYIVPEYEHDITHVIREPLDWWCNSIKESFPNLHFYRYNLLGIKPRWEHIDRGNGFIYASKEDDVIDI